MIRGLVFCVLFIAFLSSVSALTQVNIYVDEAGDATFLGVTDNEPILPEGVTVVNGRVQGTTSTLTQKNSTVWTFRYALSESEMNVILPAGATVLRVSGGEITTQQNRIEIYARNEVEVSYMISDTSSSYDAPIMILMVLIVGGVVGYWWFVHSKKRHKSVVVRKKSSPTKKPAVALEHLLHERENLILAKLRGMGKTKSSYLRKASDIPKASFSRHIHELEKKQLVRLSGEGRNKFIELT